VDDARTTLRDLLEAAGDIALERFGRIAAQRKADRTVVTEADRLAEAVILAGLRESWPEDTIVGEEGGHVEGGERTWFVDPIDGTGSYVEGLSYWGATVGLVDAQGPLLGALWLPRLGEFWFGSRGGGAYRDERRLPPLVDRAPDRDTVLYVPSRFHTWAILDYPGKCRNLGSLAAHVSMVAAGAAAAAIVPQGWQPWDVAGAMCLLEEVGGIARSPSGEPVCLQTSNREPFLVGSPMAVEYFLTPGRVRPR